IDALAASENEDWIISWFATRPGDHGRALVGLSRGGSDAAVLREFDLGSKTFVPGGFELPAAKGRAEWLDADTLLLTSPHGEGMATACGYARTVRLWRRGTAVEQATVLFEIPAESMAAYAHVDRTDAAQKVWFSEQIGFFDIAVSLGDASGPKQRLDLPTDI